MEKYTLQYGCKLVSVVSLPNTLEECRKLVMEMYGIECYSLSYKDQIGRSVKIENQGDYGNAVIHGEERNIVITVNNLEPKQGSYIDNAPLVESCFSLTELSRSTSEVEMLTGEINFSQTCEQLQSSIFTSEIQNTVNQPTPSLLHSSCITVSSSIQDQNRLDIPTFTSTSIPHSYSHFKPLELTPAPKSTPNVPFSSSATSANLFLSSNFTSNLPNTIRHILKQEILRISHLQSISRSISSAIHSDSKCSICNSSPIVGIRYRCLDCISYNLCSFCEVHSEHMHPLLKLHKLENSELIYKQQEERSKVYKLIGMGFDEEECKMTLSKYGYDMDLTVSEMLNK